VTIRRDNAQRRRAGSRKPKDRVLVVVCGARTEKLYLDGMRRHFRDSPVAIEVRSDAGSPSQPIDHAVKLWARDRDGFDQVWCVFDVDEFGRDVDRAVVAAARADVAVAVSNPCFEFWLLLHFADHTAWLNDAMAVQRKLRGRVAYYDKTRLDFAVFAPGITDAIDRGRRLSESGRDHRHNPSTTMWRLAATIVGG
jgi:hypothetical protein